MSKLQLPASPSMLAITAVMKKRITKLSTIIGVCLIFLGAASQAISASLVESHAPELETTSMTVAQARSSSPPVPPLPNPLPTAQAPSVEGIMGLTPEPTADIGIGHLRPQDLSFLENPDSVNRRYLGANWLRAAAIPIYTEPNGLHWGWIISGWLIPNNEEPIALGSDASFSMLRTYQDLFSFPVTQVRQDGWFQFQYTPVGKAWAHIDHLNLGRIDLAIESWEKRFLEMGRVEFRQHGLSQALQETPDVSATAILGLIGPESLIEPVAFYGDWMRVRVTQPTADCTPLPGAVTQEGWMRWRNTSNELLVWYPPKECGS